MCSIDPALFFEGIERAFRLRSLFKLSHTLSIRYTIDWRGKKAQW
jgi:hypothetical protein